MVAGVWEFVVNRRSNRLDSLMISAASVLSAAFLLRVVGQAAQRWMPHAWLPPVDEWQGSGMPYPILLGAQIVILTLLAFVLISMAQGRRVMGRLACRAVIGVGVVYFAIMAIRLMAGILWLPENHWFTAWISIKLHLALASIALIWGWHQLRVGTDPD